MAKENNRKQTYKKLITEHKAVLAKARTLIGLLLDRLEQEINEFDDLPDDERKTANKFWWGDKESASSILTRLTTILLKLIPLEQDIARLDLSKAELDELEHVYTKTKLPEEDIEIIERYIEKYNENRE